MLFNFGMPGLTYNMVNGYPKYTDLIMNNPDKLPLSQAMGAHFRAHPSAARSYRPRNTSSSTPSCPNSSKGVVYRPPVKRPCLPSPPPRKNPRSSPP